MEAAETLPEVIQVNDIAAVEPSPMEIIQSIIKAGGDLAMYKDMMALQKEHDAYQAKKAYVKAMAKAKQNTPKILKTKQVGFKSKKPGVAATSYKHADLGDVTGQINEWLANVGISSSFTPEQSSNGIKITCTLTHELGHSESVALLGGADNTGNKNALQSMGSTMSYLERYTLLSITGLATHDMDDDGAGSEQVQYLSVDQVTEINDRLKEANGDEIKFLKTFNAQSVETITAAQYAGALTLLKAKAGGL